MRIVFMGTPDFAVPCLAGLLEADHLMTEEELEEYMNRQEEDEE